MIQALASNFGIDMNRLGSVADAKRAERGGFDGGLWLVSDCKT